MVLTAEGIRDAGLPDWMQVRSLPPSGCGRHEKRNDLDSCQPDTSGRDDVFHHRRYLRAPFVTVSNDVVAAQYRDRGALDNALLSVVRKHSRWLCRNGVHSKTQQE